MIKNDENNQATFCTEIFSIGVFWLLNDKSLLIEAVLNSYTLRLESY